MPHSASVFRIGATCGQAALLALCAAIAPVDAVTADTAATDPSFVLRFDESFDPQSFGANWYVADFARKDGFSTAWSRSAVQRDTEDGALVLSLNATPDGVPLPLVGGEIQSNAKLHYGRYEVVMQAAPGDGVISSFFTYTGPHFGDPHDEIDFEFLGRDTTKVWINRFVGGDNLPGEWVDLGFDAAEAPHLYVFEWHPDRIVWYVDGEEFYRIDAPEHTIPSHPSKLFINIWGGGPGQKDWSGTATRDTSTEVRYYCLSFRPLDSDAETCSLPGAREAQDG